MVTAALPQAGQVPQPNVSDLGRGINGVPMPVNPAAPAPAAPAPAVNPYGAQAQQFYSMLGANQANQAYTAANQKYIDAFNASMGKEQGNLRTGLMQALGELGQRRDAAAQYVTQLPSQTNSAYQFASGLLNSGNTTAGLAPNLQAQARAQMVPLNSAIAANKSATDALAPFLNLANMANYQSGAAALRQQEMIGQNDINSQQAQFQLEQLKSAATHQQQVADQQALFAHEDKTNAEKEAFQSTQADKDRAARLAELTTQAGNAPSSNPAYATTGLNQNEINAVHNSDQYKRFNSEISAGHLNPQMIVNLLSSQGTTGQNLLAVLRADNKDYFAKGNANKNVASGPTGDPNAWYYSPLLSGFNARTVPRDITGG